MTFDYQRDSNTVLYRRNTVLKFNIYCFFMEEKSWAVNDHLSFLLQWQKHSLPYTQKEHQHCPRNACGISFKASAETAELRLLSTQQHFAALPNDFLA